MTFSIQGWQRRLYSDPANVFRSGGTILSVRERASFWCTECRNKQEDDYSYSILVYRTGANKHGANFKKPYWLTRCWQCHLRWWSARQ